MFDLRLIRRGSTTPVAICQSGIRNYFRRVAQWLTCVIVSISMVVLNAQFGISSPAATKDAGQQGVVDLASVTCRDFLQLPLPKALLLLGWVAGFNAALQHDTRVDPSAFLETAERIISSCRQNGSMTLMSLAEKHLRSGSGTTEVSPPSVPR